MSQLLLVLLLLLLVYCIPKNTTQKVDATMNEEVLAKNLIDNGFLKYADSAIFDTLDAKLKNSAYIIYDEVNNKFAQIDAEELAEFNFDFFLPQLNKILAKINMNLTVRTADDYEQTHDVFINDEKLNLYTRKELEELTFRESAAKNFFQKINAMLKSKNIDEQFYLLYQDNDLQTILLTEKQFAIISEFYVNDEKNNPYKP